MRRGNPSGAMNSHDHAKNSEGCHPERSEGSLDINEPILRYAQDDNFSQLSFKK